MEITVIKAKTEEGRTIFLKTSWNNFSFEINILAGDATWRGMCSESELRQLSERVNEPLEAYLKNVKLCFSSISDEYCYHLQPDNKDTTLFTWKTKFADGTVMKYGSLRLMSNENRESFIDYLVETTNTLKEDCVKEKQLTKSLEIELSKAVDGMKAVIELKAEMESNLYGKFVELLNAKKRRIRVLEQSLRQANVSINNDESMEL